MPAAIAIPLALAAGSAVSGVVAAKMQSGAAKDAAGLQTYAANHAADLQSKATADALTFQKQQAENDWLNSQNVQRANYDQSKARYGSIAGVASQYGLNLGGMPDYAPGIDPHYDTGATPTPPAGSVAAAGGSQVGSGTGSAADLKALLDSGVDPQAAVSQFNQKYGRTSGNEAVYYDPSQHGGVATIGLPDAYLAKPAGSWDITQRSGGAAPKAGTIAAASPYLSPTTIGAPAVNTAIPTPYQPGTIAGLAQRY